jgi:hypothetical protein
MSRARRTENLDVTFVDGVAEGWVFGVVDAFRTQLDMRLEERVDKAASLAKELELGRKLTPREKVKRSAWTRGSPPAYAFERGHIFHDPPEHYVRSLGDLRPLPRRTLVVLDARADAGALVQKADETDVELEVAAAESDISTDDRIGGGWVDYELFHYDSAGAPFSVERSSRTQADFAKLLRTGR